MYPDAVSASFSAPTNLLAGEMFNLNNSSSGANAYQWLLDDIPFSVQTNPDYVLNQPGTYRLKLIASNGNDFCDDSFEITVTVACNVSSFLPTKTYPTLLPMKAFTRFVSSWPAISVAILFVNKLPFKIPLLVFLK